MTYATEVLADSPWGYWKFDESSGSTVADASGNSRPLTLSGSYSRGQTPVADTLGDSCGLGSDVFAGRTGVSGIMATSWTVELWIEPSNWTNAAARGIFQIGNQSSSDGTWGIRHSDVSRLEGEIQVIRSGTVVMTAPAKKWTNGLPQHIVVTLNGTTLKMYRNGVEIASGSTTALNPGTTEMRWNWNYESGRGSTGKMQHAALYNTALSAARIKAHYRAGWLKAVKAEMLADVPRIYWGMDEPSGNGANDFSGHYDGTLSGAYTRAATTCPNGDNATRITGNGAGNKVEASFAATTPSAITIEYWVKPYTLYDYSCYVNDWDTQGIMYSTAQGGFGAGEWYDRRGAPSNNPMKGWINANNGLYRDVLRPGQWTHMVYSTDGVTAQIYRNGLLISRIPFNAPTIKSATKFAFAWGDVAVAHIAQYDSVLSQARIKAHYDAMVTATTGLTFIGSVSAEDYGGPMTWAFPEGTQAGDLVLIYHVSNNDGETLSFSSDGLTNSTNYTSSRKWGAAHGTVTSGMLAQGGLKPRRLDNGGEPPGSRYSAYAMAVYRNATLITPASGNNVTVTATAANQRAVTAMTGLSSNDIYDGWNKSASDAMEIRSLTPSGMYGSAALWDGPLASGSSYAGYPGMGWLPTGNSIDYASVVNWLIGETPGSGGGGSGTGDTDSNALPFTVDVPPGNPANASTFTFAQDPSIPAYPYRYHPADGSEFTFNLDPTLVPPGQEPGQAYWGFPITDSAYGGGSWAPPAPGLAPLPPARYASSDSIGIPITSVSHSLADAAQMPKILALSDGRALIIHTQTGNTTASNWTGNVEERVYAQFATPVPGGGAPTVTAPELIIDVDSLWPGEEVTPDFYQHLKPTLFSETLVLVEYIGSTFLPVRTYKSVRVLIDISGAVPVVEDLTVVDPWRSAGRPAFSIGNNKAVFMYATNYPWREHWNIEEWTGTAWNVLETFDPAPPVYPPDYGGDLCYDPSTARGLVTTGWLDFPSNFSPEAYGGCVSPFVVNEAANDITFGQSVGIGPDHENGDYAGITLAGPGVFAVHVYKNDNNVEWRDGDVPLIVGSIEVNADATLGDFVVRLETEMVKDDNWYPVTNVTAPPYEITYGWSGDARRWIALGNLEQDAWGLWCIGEDTAGVGDAAFLEIKVGDTPVAQFTGAGTGAESDYYEGFVDAVMTPQGVWLAVTFGGPVPGFDDGGAYDYQPSKLLIWHLPPWSYT